MIMNIDNNTHFFIIKKPFIKKCQADFVEFLRKKLRKILAEILVVGKQVYPKLSYAIPKGRRSGFTLGTGLYHTKDSSEKVSAQSVKN